MHKAGEIAPPVLNRVMRRSLPVNRHGKKKAALGAIRADKSVYLREAQAIFVAGALHFHQSLRLRAQIKAIERRRFRHGPVEYWIVLAVLGRGRHLAVGSHGFDAVIRKTL